MAGAINGAHATHGLVNVVLIDDHVALRKGTELLLHRDGCRVVGTADTASAGIDLVRSRRPDVIVVDIALPGRSGIDLAREVLSDDPDAGLLFYTGIDDPDLLLTAMSCGARGFAMKAGRPEELRRAVLAVARGETYLDPRMRSLVAGSSAGSPPRLSPREREVLGLLAGGMTGEQAAADLSLSAETVRTHVRNAMEKLGARTRAHAIALAMREGELDA
jgi:DNA-binding NarL/FixJ family response regulator